MKKLLCATALSLSALPALAADVGVSISVGQPGFYGHIEIGDYYPRPQLVYPQPVVIVPGRSLPPPIYLHVPPGHAKDWRRYCGRYEACGRPVYFVQDRWYNDVYVPRYRERHGGRDDYRGHPHDHHGKDRGGPGHGKGNGNGNGKGHGHGHGRD